MITRPLRVAVMIVDAVLLVAAASVTVYPLRLDVVVTGPDEPFGSAELLADGDGEAEGSSNGDPEPLGDGVGVGQFATHVGTCTVPPWSAPGYASGICRVDPLLPGIVH